MFISMTNKARFWKRSTLCFVPFISTGYTSLQLWDLTTWSALNCIYSFSWSHFFTLPVCGHKIFHQQETLYSPAFWFCWMCWLTFWPVFEILSHLPEAIFSLDVDYIVIIAIHCFTNSVFKKDPSFSILYQEFITAP